MARGLLDVMRRSKALTDEAPSLVLLVQSVDARLQVPTMIETRMVVIVQGQQRSDTRQNVHKYDIRGVGRRKQVLMSVVTEVAWYGRSHGSVVAELAASKICIKRDGGIVPNGHLQREHSLACTETLGDFAEPQVGPWHQETNSSRVAGLSDPCAPRGTVVRCGPSFFSK